MDSICAYCKSTSQYFFKLSMCREIRSEFKNLQDEDQICKKCCKKARHLLKIKSGEKPFRWKLTKDKMIQTHNETSISISNLKTRNKDWLTQTSVNVLSPSFNIAQASGNINNTAQNDTNNVVKELPEHLIKSKSKYQNLPSPIITNTDKNSIKGNWQEPFQPLQNCFNYKPGNTSKSVLEEETDITIGFKISSDSKMQKIVSKDMSDFEYKNQSGNEFFLKKKPFSQKSSNMSSFKDKLHIKEERDARTPENSLTIKEELNSTSSFDIFTYSSDEDVQCRDLSIQKANYPQIKQGYSIFPPRDSSSSIAMNENMEIITDPNISDDVFINTMDNTLVTLQSPPPFCFELERTMNSPSSEDNNELIVNIPVDSFSRGSDENCLLSKEQIKLEYFENDSVSNASHFDSVNTEFSTLSAIKSTNISESDAAISHDFEQSVVQEHFPKIFKQPSKQVKSVKFSEPNISKVSSNALKPEKLNHLLVEMQALVIGPEFKGKKRKISSLRKKITKIVVDRKRLQLEQRSRQPYTIPSINDLDDEGCVDLTDNNTTYARSPTICEETMKRLSTCTVVLERLSPAVLAKYM